MRRFSALAVFLLFFAGCSESANPVSLEVLGGYGASSFAISDFSMIELDLGATAGSAVCDINDRGQVVGYSYPAEYSGYLAVGFIWSEVDGYFLIEFPGQGNTRERFQPVAINNNGVILGEYFSSYYAKGEVAIWSETAGLQKLGVTTYVTLMGGINDANEVVAQIYDPFYNNQAMYWSEATDVQYMQDSGPYARAYDINRSSQISAWDRNALIWTPDGSKTELGHGGHGFAINNNGDITGRFGNGAFFQPSGGSVIMIGDLGYPYGDRGAGWDLNDAGVVVGESYDVNSRQQPSIWNMESGIQQLPIPVDSYGGVAQGINEAGTVAGHYWPLNSPSRAVIWVSAPATPEALMAEVVASLAELVQAGNLPANNADALINKVELAAKKLAKNNPEGALGSLQAAINQLFAFMNARKLAEDLGMELVTTLQSVIDMIKTP
ncbi:hypothetical protein ACFL3H_08625 [Gemmatimonadota bacterium]